MKNKKIVFIFLIAVSVLCAVVACGKEKKPKGVLHGQNLTVYCDNSLRNGFQHIFDEFKDKTDCELIVKYLNFSQMKKQIIEKKDADFIIVDDKDDLAEFGEHLISTIDIGEHKPCIIVEDGNPKNINSLMDLANDDVNTVIGEVRATSLGKIAIEVLKANGINDKVHINRTAPNTFSMVGAVANQEADAAIVWEENVMISGVEEVYTESFDDYVKIISSGRLDYVINDQPKVHFEEYLNTKGCRDLLSKYDHIVYIKEVNDEKNN